MGIRPRFPCENPLLLFKFYVGGGGGGKAVTEHAPGTFLGKITFFNPP